MQRYSYPHEIRTIQDWECYLDWQDEHISIQGNSVLCKFENEYSITFANCSSPTKVLIEAFILLTHLKNCEPAAHADYIAKRFIELVRKPLKLPHDLPEMFEELSQALNVSPKPVKNVHDIPAQ